MSDHSASRRPIETDSSPSSQPTTVGGSGALPSWRSPRAASTPAGSVAVRLLTAGLASIFDAWFSVIPVIANSSMPIRQTAELIQCH
jgi:hypothetical protein